MQPGYLSLIVVALIGLVLLVTWVMSRWEERRVRAYREAFRAGVDFANGKLKTLPSEVRNHGK